MSAPSWPEQRSEGYRSARGLAVAAWLSVLMLGALFGLAVFAWPASAAGSDSATPYTVDRTGITLPAGEVFPEHGHVNVRWDGGSAGVHFDPNNGHPGGAWIGQPSIPWSAFGVPAGACVMWVQISTFNEHFGEGGQPPVCLTEETPWTPDPTPTATDSSSPQPSPEPSESAPSVPSEPKPAVTPSPGPVTEPTAPPTSSPAATESATAPVVTSAPTEYRSEVSAVEEPTAPRELAATGTTPGWVAVGALSLIAIGAVIVAARKEHHR